MVFTNDQEVSYLIIIVITELPVLCHSLSMPNQIQLSSEQGKHKTEQFFLPKLIIKLDLYVEVLLCQC